MVSKKIKHIICNNSLINNITNYIDKHDKMDAVLFIIKKGFDISILNYINIAEKCIS